MSESACKAAICDDEAQGRMNTAVDKIHSISGASAKLRVEHAEIYINAMKKAAAKADKLVMESGE